MSEAQQNWDSVCKELAQRSPGSLPSWFLMSTYAYHFMNADLLSLTMHKVLVRRMIAMLEDGTEHKHLDLVRTYLDRAPNTKVPLAQEDYPTSITAATLHILCLEYPRQTMKRVKETGSPLLSNITIRKRERPVHAQS